jgi:hypothetical protein
MGLQRSKYIKVEDDIDRLRDTYHILKEQMAK